MTKRMIGGPVGRKSAESINYGVAVIVIVNNCFPGQAVQARVEVPGPTEREIRTLCGFLHPWQIPTA